MTFEKVAKLAIEALERDRKRYAPEANMQIRLGIVSPATERARKHYDQLTEAIAELQELGKRP
jgi:hypothetical protein